MISKGTCSFENLWRLLKIIKNIVFLNLKFTPTDLSPSSSHLLIIFSVIIYFILYGLMLCQQTLCFRQRCRCVLGCHGGLCTRQPGLEVIKISKEALKLRGFAQRLLAPFHGGSQLIPHLLDFSQSTLDLLSCSACSDVNFSASECRSSSLPCGEESRRE